MAKKPVPKFIESPYFVMEPGNWHLKPGAPSDIQDEFNQYMDIVRKEKKSPTLVERWCSDTVPFRFVN